MKKKVLVIAVALFVALGTGWVLLQSRDDEDPEGHVAAERNDKLEGEEAALRQRARALETQLANAQAKLRELESQLSERKELEVANADEAKPPQLAVNSKPAVASKGKGKGKGKGKLE